MSEVSKAFSPTTAHEQLSRMVGDWEGVARTWFEPGDPVDESPVSGTMKLILGGRFILHEYTGRFGEKPLEGMAIYGYHKALEKFQCAWVDSFHNDTAIMFSAGDKNHPDFNVLGSYAYIAPGVEQHWGWRTHIEMEGSDGIIITAYNISPGGEETKATETVYKKKR